MAEDSIPTKKNYKNRITISNSELENLVNQYNPNNNFCDWIFKSDKCRSYGVGMSVFLGNLIYNVNEKVMQMGYEVGSGANNYFNYVDKIINNPELLDMNKIEMAVSTLTFPIFWGIISAIGVYGGIKGVKAGVREGKKLYEKIDKKIGDTTVKYFNDSNHQLVVTK